MSFLMKRHILPLVSYPSLTPVAVPLFSAGRAVHYVRIAFLFLPFSPFEKLSSSTLLSSSDQQGQKDWFLIKRCT